MTIVVCGLNHQTAPLPIREPLSFSTRELPGKLQHIKQACGLEELVLLSTCNRTEIIATPHTPEKLYAWLTSAHPQAQFRTDEFYYCHEGHAAITHLLRLASGLDSMVLGEPQILGQLKQAYDLAIQHECVGSELHHLFQYIFEQAKGVRFDTSLGQHSLSVAAIAVNLAKRIFSDLTQCNVMFVGTGETIALAAKHFQTQSVARMFFAGRDLASANQLASNYQACSLVLSEIPNYLASVDMLITATASPLPIIGKGMLEHAIKQRKNKPMFIVDLAVPRDVEPQAANLSNVYLYNVDDLQTLANESARKRRKASDKAHTLITQAADDYLRLLRLSQDKHIIREYRRAMLKLRETCLAKAHEQLAHGIPVEQVMQRLAYTLTNKLTHHPTMILRQAAMTGEAALLEAAQAYLPELTKSE